MKKIWSFIAMVFIGFSAGLIAMYKLMGDQIEINIKKIKTKKGSSSVTVPISIESRKDRRKSNKKRKNGPE